MSIPQVFIARFIPEEYLVLANLLAGMRSEQLWHYVNPQVHLTDLE